MVFPGPGQSGVCFFDGPVGSMEVIVDMPQGEARGLALLAHPQPLQGGHAKHKIVQLLARALADAGWLVARPNFRGVGASAGLHDAGMGETQDLLALYRQLQAARPQPKTALLGFSFGAFVQARVASELLRLDETPWRTCLMGMPSGEVDGGRRYDSPTDLPDALVVHGEHDQRVPLHAVLDWARPQSRPVVVVPGADHFFTGKLHILRQLVLAHLCA
ncbi:MAG: alpha/beta fold hydrolase [Comamonas sp.]